MGVPTPCSRGVPHPKRKEGKGRREFTCLYFKVRQCFRLQLYRLERGNMSYKSQYRTLFQRTINQLTNFQKNIKILRDIKIAEVVKFEACKYGTDMPISKKKIKEIKEWRVLYYFLTIQKKKKNINSSNIQLGYVFVFNENCLQNHLVYTQFTQCLKQMTNSITLQSGLKL